MKRKDLTITRLRKAAIVAAEAEGLNRQKARLMCRPIDRPNIDPQFVDKSMNVAVTRGGGASQLGYSSLA